MFPPAVDRLGADTVLLGHLGDRPLIGLPEDGHHLLFGESGLLHGSLVSSRAPFSQLLVVRKTPVTSRALQPATPRKQHSGGNKRRARSTPYQHVLRRASELDGSHEHAA